MRATLGARMPSTSHSRRIGLQAVHVAGGAQEECVFRRARLSEQGDGGVLDARLGVRGQLREHAHVAGAALEPGGRAVRLPPGALRPGQCRSLVDGSRRGDVRGTLSGRLKSGSGLEDVVGQWENVDFFDDRRDPVRAGQVDFIVSTYLLSGTQQPPAKKLGERLVFHSADYLLTSQTESSEDLHEMKGTKIVDMLHRIV